MHVPLRRRLTTTMIAVGVMTLALVAVRAPAEAATGSPVVGVDSGRCLDVVGQSQADQARLNLYDCVGQANQAWTLTSAGELRVYDQPKCLDVAGQATTAPAVVQIYRCTGNANQKWRLNTDGSIAGVQSGLCLDVTGGDNEASRANGTPVELWTCHGGSNQQWSLR